LIGTLSALNLTWGLCADVGIVARSTGWRLRPYGIRGHADGYGEHAGFQLHRHTFLVFTRRAGGAIGFDPLDGASSMDVCRIIDVDCTQQLER
jgi:hypothetical protein